MLCFFAEMFAPKDALVRRARAEHGWPVHGRPEIVLTDRGKVFAARDVREALLAQGVILEFAPAYQPHYKGIVERFQRTFNQLLAHRLPGTVRSGRQKRPSGLVKGEALRNGLLVSQLPQIITRFIADGYHERFHRGIRDIPVKRWRDLVTKYGPPRQIEPSPASELRQRLMTRIRADRQGRRAHTKQGYSFEGHFFTPQIPAPKTGVVYYDPRDVRRISIFTTSGAYVCEAYLRGWDLSVPITQRGLKERTRNAASMKARTAKADRTIARIVSAAHAGKNLTATDATALEGHRAALQAAKTTNVRAFPKPKRIEDDLVLQKLA